MPSLCACESSSSTRGSVTSVRAVKLGYMIGYWGSGPPTGVPAGLAEAERLGFDSCWTAEAYGSDAAHTARVVGRRDRTHQARYVDLPDLGAHTHRDGDGRAHARPSLRRPLRARARCVGPAGGGRLVRRRLPPAARTHARVRRDRAASAPARCAGRVQGRPLPTTEPERHRLRQAVEVDRAPAPRRSSDLPRGRRPEERRALGRDRRRLAADVLRAACRRFLP